MRRAVSWFGRMSVLLAVGCQAPRPAAPELTQVVPAERRAGETTSAAPADDDVVTWERFVADAAAAHGALSEVPYDTCPSSFVLRRYLGLNEGAAFRCDYDDYTARQPKGWYRIWSVYLVPRPDAAAPAKLEARRIELRVVDDTKADDLLAALGFDDALPPATHLQDRTVSWIRPHAKPGEVFFIRRVQGDEAVDLRLYVLPRTPAHAKRMLEYNWAGQPKGHTPVILKSRLSIESDRPMIRLSKDGLHADGVALGEEPLSNALERLFKRKKREKELLTQEFIFELNIDISRATPAPDALALLAELSSSEVGGHTPRLHLTGRDMNAMGHPALSSREASSDALSVRDVLAPKPTEKEQDEIRERFDPPPTADEPSCAPYTVCREGDAPRADTLARLDDAGEWDAARDGYAKALATLSPGWVRAIVRAEGSPTRIELTVRDPNLTWQTTTDLRTALGLPLTTNPMGKAPCDEGIGLETDFPTAEVCHDAFRDEPDLIRDVTLLNAPTP